MNTEIIPPDAPEANLGAAVDFLATIAGGGRIAVTSIVPDGPLASAIFDTVAQRAELGNWLGRYNGLANLYFSLNEPTPEATGRLKERDVAVIRGIAVDIDPDATEEAKPGGFERERARLHGVAKEWADHFFSTPTAIVDSGGGIQMFWLLREPQPNTDECQAAVKAQAKALCRYLGSDAVQSIDHLFRVPSTENLPPAKKAARGRKRAPVRLLHMSATERTSLPTLAMIAAPVAEPDQPAVELDGFDYNAVIEVAEDPKSLPAHLASALESVRQSSRGLATALANPDRSNRDFALAAIVVEAGITDPTEIGQLAFSLSPDRLVEEDGRGRGEWYANRTVREALQRTKPRPTELDFFTGSPPPDDTTLPNLFVVSGPLNAQDFPIERHVIYPRLPVGDVTQGVGEPGIAKSTLALRDALIISTGRDNLLGNTADGRGVTGERLHQAGPVLVYNAEDRLSIMAKRVIAARRKYGVSDTDLQHPIILWSGPDHGALVIMERTGERGPLRRASGADTLERVIRHYGIVAVIADPQISLATGASENSNEDQDAIMQELATIAARHAINIHVLHHTGKQTRNNAGDMGAGRGGFAAVAKARCAYTLTYVTGGGPGEEAWGVTRADGLIRLDYSKVSHSAKPPEPIVFRRVSVNVGNGTGAAPAKADGLFYRSHLEQLKAEGETFPVLELVDIKALAAAAARKVAASASAGAEKIAYIADAVLGDANEAPLASVWETVGDEMRKVGLIQATTRQAITPAITAALGAGVVIDSGGQQIRIETVRRGGGLTAPWMLRRSLPPSRGAFS